MRHLKILLLTVPFLVLIFSAVAAPQIKAETRRTDPVLTSCTETADKKKNKKAKDACKSVVDMARDAASNLPICTNATNDSEKARCIEKEAKNYISRAIRSKNNPKNEAQFKNNLQTLFDQDGVTSGRVSGSTNLGNGSVPSEAGLCADHSNKRFFGLLPWYHYIPQSEFSDACTIKCFNFFTQSVANECGETASDIPGVLLVIIDDLMRLAGIIAIAFILVSSFQFVTSQGNPDQAASARSTLINALLGLVVALIAVAFVTFVGNKLGG